MFLIIVNNYININDFIIDLNKTRLRLIIEQESYKIFNNFLTSLNI